MKKIFENIISNFENGNDIAILTIIASSGSTPRGSGARMVVSNEGVVGTIGGGIIEYKSIEIAKETIKDKKSKIQSFKLNREDVSNLGMICGGDVTVYFEFVPHNDMNFYEICVQLLNQIEKDEDTWLIMDITSEKVNDIGFYSKSLGLINIEENEIIEKLENKAIQVIINSKKYYIEKIVTSGKVYIFGGGHIAQALVPILTSVNFKCVVLEDRSDFATKELFPTASELKVIDCNNILDSVSFTKNEYACIMTRGHEYDYIIQKQLLETELEYIGVMGSRAKMEGIAKRFASEGYDENVIQRFKSPIGLPIKAETPAEIAISIASELILVRANRYEKQ